MPASPKPRSAFRRVERWMMGVVMSVLAFVIEKAVLRSIKKGGTQPAARPGEPFAKGSGSDLSV
jgi:glutathione S-transferase